MYVANTKDYMLTGGQRSGDVLVVRSGRVLPLGEWARVRAGRYGRRIFLWVSNNVVILFHKAHQIVNFV